MAQVNWVESKKEMEAILQREPWGMLGVVLDGRPYCVPLNHAYIDGKILFHCSMEGRKLDGIVADPFVCYTVAWQSGDVQEHECRSCHPACDSVICSGRARIIEDQTERKALLNAFNRAFRPNSKELELPALVGCACVEIDVTEMTGRVERDRKCEFYRWRR